MQKKRLALIASGAILAMSLTIGGATYALFTSSASNNGNSFAAGTVHLTEERDNGDPIPGPMFYPNSLDPLANHPYDASDSEPSGESIGGWAPGDIVLRDMYLKNTGSLTAKLTGIRAKVRDSYTQTTTVDGVTETHTVTGVSDRDAYHEFIDNMNVKVMNSSTVIYDGLLSDLIKDDTVWVPVAPLVKINPAPSGPLNLTFTATLSKDAGNAIQGKNFIFDFELNAEQFKNNP